MHGICLNLIQVSGPPSSSMTFFCSASQGLNFICEPQEERLDLRFLDKNKINIIRTHRTARYTCAPALHVRVPSPTTKLNFRTHYAPAHISKCLLDFIINTNPASCHNGLLRASLSRPAPTNEREGHASATAQASIVLRCLRCGKGAM